MTAARHDPTGEGMEVEVEGLLAAEPAVLIAATAGHPCVVTLETAEAWPDAPPVIVPEFCASPYTYVANRGASYDGLLSLRAIVDGTEASVADTTLGRAASSSFGSERFNFGSTAEWAPMWQAVQILQIAAELPGGLTRSNIAIAGWSFRGRFPLVEGEIGLSWPDDAEAVTAARLHRWDPEAEEWHPTDIEVDVAAGRDRPAEPSSG